MNYLALNVVFMLIAFVILNVFVRKSSWKLIGWTLLVMVLVTLIFDNLIVALGIVDYDTTKISGVLLGLVPIEDFAYTVVSVLAVSAIWHKLTKEK
ncbi:MAG: lycopene cyclase domain-containing protein [Micrococcales bacterium]|nr:lycopene cyclase domain-containing protein [Actinomycetota bacterium]NCA08260.1 lycopene cyclase domain-containing protein [Micrococcales bacterium]